MSICAPWRQSSNTCVEPGLRCAGLRLSTAPTANVRWSIDASNPRLRRRGEVAKLDRPHRGLGAVGHAELVDDPLDMHLHGSDADEQALSDLGIRFALRHQAQDVELA